MRCHFFGASEAPLFGCYHAPRKSAEAKPPGRRNIAVLICPPVGHEYFRCHWSLRRLAAQLARKGFPVLRFDYFGVGDSAGNLAEIESLDVWTDNIIQARQNLTDESGARDVIFLGVRLGGNLAARALQAKSGNSISNGDSLLQWDPLLDGDGYLSALRNMQTAMLDLWYCPVENQTASNCEELLGSIYRHELINEIQSLAIGDAMQDERLLQACVVPTSETQEFVSRLPHTKVLGHSDVNYWQRLDQIETAWLPTNAPKLIETEVANFASEGSRPYGVSANPLPQVEHAPYASLNVNAEVRSS